MKEENYITVCAWCNNYYDSIYQEWIPKQEYENIYITENAILTHGVCDESCLNDLLEDI